MVDSTQEIATPLVDCALRLAEQGFHIIPLGGCGERPPHYFIERERRPELSYETTARLASAKWSKTPRIKWKEFQQTAASEEQIRQWWQTHSNANIGVVTGINLVVVDADNQAAMDWIEAKNITFTPRRVITGKGKHYYYQVNPELEIRNSVDVNSRIDIRGVGGYVVGPGSLHHTLKRYTEELIPGFDTDQVSDLPMLTKDDLDALNGFNTVSRHLPPNEAETVYCDMSTVQLPADFSPAVEGERNNTAASLAGQMIREGKSIIETIAAIRAWNATNEAPLPDGEIVHTVESVAKTHARNTGLVVPAAPLPPPDPVVVKVEAESVAFPMGFILDNPPPPIENFWGEDLLYRRARFMIAGRPKIGKSRFALSMAMQAACGGRFLGRDFVKPIKTLWLQAEITRPYLYRRLSSSTRSLSAAERFLARDQLIVTERCHWDLTSEHDLMRMHMILAKHRPDWLIIDPLIECASIDENNAKEVSQLLKSLAMLEEEFNFATGIVHHVKKVGRDGPTFEDVRGSSVFSGWIDTGVLLTGTDERTQVSYLARETSVPSHTIVWDGGKGNYDVDLADVVPLVEAEDTSKDRDAGMECRDKLVGLVKQNGTGLSVSMLRTIMHDKNPGLSKAALEAGLTLLASFGGVAAVDMDGELGYSGIK